MGCFYLKWTDFFFSLVFFFFFVSFVLCATLPMMAGSRHPNMARCTFARCRRFRPHPTLHFNNPTCSIEINWQTSDTRKLLLHRVTNITFKLFYSYVCTTELHFRNSSVSRHRAQSTENLTGRRVGSFRQNFGKV